MTDKPPTHPHTDAPVSTPVSTARNKPRLTFASGGWVLLVAGVLCLGVLLWASAGPLFRAFNPPPGDGRNPETYGFDLANFTGDRALLVPGMLHRDMAPAMFEVSHERGADIQSLNEAQRGKVLVPSDEVIGVRIGQQSCAYPLRLLYVHEIVNDTLDDTPIAVTYHWPCHSSRVFDRRVGDRTAEFAVSGLMYNYNLLMYDRNPGSLSDADIDAGQDASLWSQMGAVAMSGPAVGTPLTTYSSELTTWSDWFDRNPDTEVAMLNPRLAKRYKDAAPDTFIHTKQRLFPIAVEPPADGPEDYERIIGLRAGDTYYAFAETWIRARIAHDAEETIGMWQETRDGATITFEQLPGSTLIRASLELDGDWDDFDADAYELMTAYWFAWNAWRPNATLVK